MKIALVSSFVPFIQGGARNIVEWLEEKLLVHGHQVERFYLPFIDRAEDLFDQTLAFRLLDLTGACDRLIAFRPPSHVLRHPNKVLWFIHHIRPLYDLWDSPYSLVPHSRAGHAFRQAQIDIDTAAILEAQHVFTNSNVVAERLAKFNGVKATTLYPPILAPERFKNLGFGDEIVAVSRIEPHKRQWLLIEAMRHVKSHVKLRICGAGANPDHVQNLQDRIAQFGLGSKIAIENRWISEEEKADLVGKSLAVAYVPVDEDSYGYPSLEGGHSEKPVLTTADAGGVLELVSDGVNGLVSAPEPLALAEAMDSLYNNRDLAVRMGKANLSRIGELRIDWDRVVEALTS
jgi:glycosyltransferase involved in cell wall biosynthesis